MKAAFLAALFAVAQKARLPLPMIGKSAFICNECVEHYLHLGPEVSQLRGCPESNWFAEALRDPPDYGKTNRRHSALFVLR
jgi:hypothetical protein